MPRLKLSRLAQSYGLEETQVGTPVSYKHIADNIMVFKSLYFHPSSTLQISDAEGKEEAVSLEKYQDVDSALEMPDHVWFGFCTGVYELHAHTHSHTSCVIVTALKSNVPSTVSQVRDIQPLLFLVLARCITLHLIEFKLSIGA